MVKYLLGRYENYTSPKLKSQVINEKKQSKNSNSVGIIHPSQFFFSFFFSLREMQFISSIHPHFSLHGCKT